MCVTTLEAHLGLSHAPRMGDKSAPTTPNIMFDAQFETEEGDSLIWI